jgi:hypothetical protein
MRISAVNAYDKTEALGGRGTIADASHSTRSGRLPRGDSSRVHTITGAATSPTAFIGRARHAPVDNPVTVCSLGDFEGQLGIPGGEARRMPGGRRKQGG